MKLQDLNADRLSLRLSLDELGTIGNALNEVCHGLRVANFTSKMGDKRKNVSLFLDQIVPVYRKADRSGSSHVTLSFSGRELRSIIGALRTVYREIAEFEFQTRMGDESSEVEEIIDKLIPIYRKMKELGSSTPPES
jgi:hypothetical protein